MDKKLSLSGALQAASPLSLGMSQGLHNGNPMGGLQRGMVGMMALQERAKKEQAEEGLNKALAGMNIPAAQRAVLESMPVSMKSQYLMKMMHGGVGQGGGDGRAAAPAAPAPSGENLLSYVMGGGDLQTQGGAAQMPQGQSPMPMAPSQELSFGTPVDAPAAPESPLAMAMATPAAMERPTLSFPEPAPEPEPVNQVDVFTARIGSG